MAKIKETFGIDLVDADSKSTFGGRSARYTSQRHGRLWKRPFLNTKENPLYWISHNESERLPCHTPLPAGVLTAEKEFTARFPSLVAADQKTIE